MTRHEQIEAFIQWYSQATHEERVEASNIMYGWLLRTLKRMVNTELERRDQARIDAEFYALMDGVL